MKLVRDNIPEIASANGDNWQFRVAKEHEKYDLLMRKLKEEVGELSQALSKQEKLEELADVMEVLIAFCEYIGLDEEEFLDVSTNKLNERGGYKKWIVME